MAITALQAQVSVMSSGQTQFGDNSATQSSGSALTTPVNANASLIVYPLQGKNNGAQIIFGNSNAISRNAAIGESYRNSGKLWIHGKNGITYTTGSRANDTIFFYDTSSTCFNFNTLVSAKRYLLQTSSDIKTGDASSLSQKAITNASGLLKVGIYELPEKSNTSYKKSNEGIA